MKFHPVTMKTPKAPMGPLDDKAAALILQGRVAAKLAGSPKAAKARKVAMKKKAVPFKGVSTATGRAMPKGTPPAKAPPFAGALSRPMNFGK